MNTSSTRFDLKRITHPANRLGLIGAGLLVATVAFGVYQAAPIINAVRAGGAPGDASDGSDAVLKFASTLKNDTDQINGRSFFFDPPPPPPPRVERPPEPPREDPGPPKPPPPPSSYGGPKVVGTAFDTVWFDSNKTMRVGGPLQDDMRILSISTAPYVVKIEWKGVVFDVPFLPRDSVIDKSRPAPAAPPPDPTPPPATTPTPPKPGDSPAPATSQPATPAPATPDDKKEEKKEEPKPAGGEAPKPAGETPTTPPSPPDKKDGPT